MSEATNTSMELLLGVAIEMFCIDSCLPVVLALWSALAWMLVDCLLVYSYKRHNVTEFENYAMIGHCIIF